MTAKRPVKQEPDLVIPEDDMLAQAFRLHCQKRHPLLKFWSRGEHAADHRLHQNTLDHVHSEPEQDPEEVDEQESDKVD